MEVKSGAPHTGYAREVFPVCFIIGLLGFLLTWQRGEDYSGLRGFLIGFFVPYVLYILFSLFRRRESKVSKADIVVKKEDIRIVETNSGGHVEINIIIPKSILTDKD